MKILIVLILLFVKCNFKNIGGSFKFKYYIEKVFFKKNICDMILEGKKVMKVCEL